MITSTCGCAERLLLVAVLLSAWPSSARAEPGSVGHHATMIDTAAAFPHPRRTAARRDVVVLHGDRTADARRLKAHNPRLVVLAYLNLSAMSTAVPSGYSTGVQTHAENWRGRVTDRGPGYAARNERWYLHTRKGRRFTFRSYPWLWAANVADRGYQRQWTSNALRLLAARPEFDGLFIDDVNPTIRYHHDPLDVRELPSDEAYANATGEALAAIAPRIRAAGRLVYANLGAWTDHGEQIRPWLRQLDGAMDEQWVKFGSRRGSGYRDEAGWTRQVANVAEASAAGVHVMTVTHSANADAAAARYGYASALLAARGRVVFASVGDYHTETWFRDYELDLGAPKGPMRTHDGGLRSREFKRGLVLVNPTASAQGTLPPRSAVIQASSGQ
jgi:hypothetical protein